AIAEKETDDQTAVLLGNLPQQAGLHELPVYPVGQHQDKAHQYQWIAQVGRYLLKSYNVHCSAPMFLCSG
ncbi:MAG: hypothetical protein D3920_15925, partial [Candidatus Electrothrix sp. AW2]|nr:hypothetical protein [Candidatus Electrothrix gigas]